MKTELTITADGQTHPVSIDDTDGMFSVNLGVVDGTSNIVRAESFAELERKIRKVRTRFELPFTQSYSSRVRHGKVTGIHATNGNLLVRWDDGSTEQLSSWSGQQGTVMPRLTDEETEQLRELIRARDRAVWELEAFTRPRKYDSLNKAAKDARAKAAGQD